MLFFLCYDLILLLNLFILEVDLFLADISKLLGEDFSLEHAILEN